MGLGQSAGVRHRAASSTSPVRSPSGRRQTQICSQSWRNPQKPIAQVDENPSQSKSFRQGTGTRLVVVVLVAKVDDVLGVVLVDVVVPRTSPNVVVVRSGICPPPPPPIVVVGPPTVVVVVVAGAMHRSERGVGRQRSMSFAGAAPGVRAMRSGRVLRTGTVNV